jgi:hypothetical protein
MAMRMFSLATKIFLMATRILQTATNKKNKYNNISKTLRLLVTAVCVNDVGLGLIWTIGRLPFFFKLYFPLKVFGTFVYVSV